LSLTDDKKEVNATEKVSGHQSCVNEVCISPDGHRLVSASDDGSFALWDFTTMKKIRHVSRSEPFQLRSFKSAQFSNSGQLIVTASDDGQVILWDSRTREEVQNVAKHKGPATSCVFGSDNSTIVSGGWDNQVHITDIKGTKNQVLSGHEDWVLSVDISSDSRLVVSSGWDSNIRLWSNGTEKSVLLGHSKTVTSVVFSPDSRYIASASYDSCVKLWNTSNGKLEKTLAGHVGHVNSVTFGTKSDNLLLSAGSDHTVKIWDVSNGHLKNEFICQGPATSVAIQSDLVMVYGDSIGNIHISKLVHM